MSEDICGQRFKGVENFLRRIAFNLGNTPSQTEVKVISCIPIDVTDLQHKITLLEQQLEAANSQPKPSQPRAIGEDKREERRESTVHPAICSKTYLSKTPSYKNIGCYCCPSSILPSEPTCILNPSPTADLPQNCQENSSTDKSDMNTKDKYKPDACRRNIFTRKKKIFRKKKVNTQMVYYAQTESLNPFCNNLGDEGTSKDERRRESNIFNRHFMTNVVHKQYAPSPINEGTDVSEYSTPVCRDIPSTVEETLQRPQRPCDPDICSCCCGQFKNLDNKINEHIRCDLSSLLTDSRSAYYDSNFYDVVPVKDNTTKTKRGYPKRKEFRNKLDVLYWPEKIRPSYKTPQIIYQSIAPPRIRKVFMKPQNRKDTLLNKRAKINPALYKINPRAKTQVKAWTDSFEFSSIYAKQSNNAKHTIFKHQIATTDAACLTIPITNTECQITSDTNRDEIKKDITTTPSSPECKTQATLNQIKNILQTVLHEVKTNSNKSQIPIRMKKDAIVQNGPSQSYINEGSSLIKSFTYSPYNMNPYGGGASCSKQMPNNSFWDANIPQVPVKCLHYPLFIPPEKNMCTSCYRNHPQVKVPHMKYATSTATNTEVRTRSKETESLIKEIYKSLALHVNMPTKDTVVSRNDIKESIRNFNTKVEKREAKHVAQAISEIFKNQKPLDNSSITQTLTPLDSKPVSNKCSSKSQPIKNYKFSSKKESVDYYTNDVVSESVDKTETEKMSQQLESEDNYDDDDEDEDVTHQQNDESESSVICETESDVVEVKFQDPEAQKKKTGFFSKMLKVFQPRSRNRRKVKEEKEIPPTDTDSDDYLTVYSRGTSPSRHTTKPSQCKAQSKVIYYSKLPRKLKEKSPKSRNSPYMEQEYRRYFNEKLTFHDKPKRKSTKSTASQKISPYYQRVEARNAFVGNSGSIYGTTQNQTRMNQTSRHEETGLHFHVPVREPKVTPNALSWMKKHKPGLKCAPAWKKLILEG